jgi:hypothetical protein
MDSLDSRHRIDLSLSEIAVFAYLRAIRLIDRGSREVTLPFGAILYVCHPRPVNGYQVRASNFAPPKDVFSAEAESRNGVGSYARGTTRQDFATLRVTRYVASARADCQKVVMDGGTR